MEYTAVNNPSLKLNNWLTNKTPAMWLITPTCVRQLGSQFFIYNSVSQLSVCGPASVLVRGKFLLVWKTFTTKDLSFLKTVGRRRFQRLLSSPVKKKSNKRTDHLQFLQLLLLLFLLQAYIFGVTLMYLFFPVIS
jgi:hypothetical protein